MIELANLREGYWVVCQYVELNGERTQPRGRPTREVLAETIRLDDPTDALPVGTGRKVGLRLAATEALQIVGGYSDPEALVRAAPQMAAFEDFPGYRHGAYGPRLGWKVREVVRRLHDQPLTRQAQLTIWEDGRDLTIEQTRDYPCTTALQFLVRHGQVVAHTTMRSNDVWLGLAYDAFCFTQLQLTIANSLGWTAGPYYHHAVSLHLYEDDVPKLDDLVRWPSRGPVPARGFGFPGADPVARAWAIGNGVLPADATESERWYYETACHLGNR